MDEATKRVTGVLDEFQKKQDDFMLDTAVKIGGGAIVGLTFGILTKRFMKIRKPVVAGSFVGFGMAIERYSQQLSAPYVQPPTCEIAVSPSRVFADTWHGSLPTGIVSSLSALKESFSSSSSAEPTKSDEPPKEEPVDPTPEPEVANSDAAAEEPSADSIIEEIKDVSVEVTEPAEQESIVDVVARELKDEINKVATEVEIIASDVETVAEHVEQAAETVEHVAEKIDSIPMAEKVEEVALEVATDAAEVEQAAEVTEHIAQEVKDATE